MATGFVKQHKQRAIRRISGRIDNNGTASIIEGSGFSIARNGTGDITITITKPGKKLMAVCLTPINSTAATSHMAKVLAVTNAESVQVGTYVADGTDGAPADINFFFEICLKDVSN